jgi:hypothetical protein
MNIEQLEIELKKLPMMPAWGRKQFDDWDKLSSFVYALPSYEKLQEELKRLNKPTEFNNYVIHRWYNTLSAVGVEKIFSKLPNVLPNTNRYDKLVDFSINNITFDHKTTVYPRNFGHDINFAKQNPQKLISWLYAEQSKEGRFHTSNRLFIVLHKADTHHWKLRAELTRMKPVISDYVNTFDYEKLHRLNLETGKTTLSDVIWFCD